MFKHGSVSAPDCFLWSMVDVDTWVHLLNTLRLSMFTKHCLTLSRAADGLHRLLHLLQGDPVLVQSLEPKQRGNLGLISLCIDDYKRREQNYVYYELLTYCKADYKRRGK